MCEIESPNLIDLSTEEDNVGNNESLMKPNVTQPLIPSPQGRLSLDNNPFDYVQKLTSYAEDPFDVVEKEASLKARETTEVRIGNLLSLSSEPELNGSEITKSALEAYSQSYQNSNYIDLDNESPPANLDAKLTPGSSTASSCESSDSARAQGNSQRSRKVRQQRHRLLKLSITNATFNTPMSSRKNVIDKSAFESGSNTFSIVAENMLASESPLKLVDDDIMSEQPSNVNYTEKDYDADLKLLEIPMLKQLSSHTEKILEIPDKAVMEPVDNSSKPLTINTDDKLKNKDILNVAAALPDITEIRKKLHAKRTETANKDITELIKSLKTMICESDAVDAQKKLKVNCLLETLTSTLNTSSSSSNSSPPQPIVRQDTFDMDLKNTETESVEDNSNETVHCVDQQMSHDRTPEIPDIMIQSSATYDGETADDKAYLNLPQIDPISPNQDTLHPNINELMEQIQRLLEQNHLNPQSHVDSSCTTNNNHASSIANNPTVIVVMPTISQTAVNEETKEFATENCIRRRSQSLSVHDKLKIVTLPLNPSPSEISSTENYDSPPLPSTNISSSDVDFKTPARYLSRRNSISSTTPYTPMRCSRFNVSALNKIRSSGHETTQHSFATSSRLSSIESHNETQLSQVTSRTIFGLVKPDPKKKVKTANSILKSNGPLKATVPMNKIAPTIKINSRNINSNTSINLVAKSGHMANTSTPMTSNRSNGLNESNKAYPAACSTPTGSSGKLTNNTKRFSNIPTTPIGKSLKVSTSSVAGLRRRTISDLRTNSPMRPKSGAQDAIGSAVGSTHSKLNTNRPSVNSKTMTKMRASTSGTNPTHFANKNKENKKPDKL